MPSYYEWDFYTKSISTARVCHRGPMIDVEVRMSQPFIRLIDFESHRIALLQNLVNTSLPEVQTRECVLRVLNSDLSSIIVRLYPVKDDLQVRICEKKNAIDIDVALASLPVSFKKIATKLLDFDISQRTIDLISSALDSNNATLRVAGCCAIILIAAYAELGS